MRVTVNLLPGARPVRITPQALKVLWIDSAHGMSALPASAPCFTKAYAAAEISFSTTFCHDSFMASSFSRPLSPMRRARSRLE